MRFSAVAVAALATQAAAWRGQGPPSGSYWGWGNTGVEASKAADDCSGAEVTSTSTITLPAATAPPAATSAAPVVTPSAAAPVEEAVSTTSSAAPAATTAASSGTSGLTSDQQAALDAHNAARSDVGVPALEWDATLAANAQEWATNLLSVGSLTHSQVSDQGENLYMQSNTDSPYINAANAWIAEKSSYNGETISESNYMGFGHYTQIVWKSTTKVGLAVATNSQGTYVVARYSPPGNYIGEKPY
ncbi:SCP-like extracellular protein [Colletotrichum costaricense]|uniref:SCP-like extracellular protein n=2 Tax=Colletotrichum acutatum species complex TaxID=2707335 RepID=A0AAJ0E045_9PEZI|nr:SCP-like extracellular protein [Colletotrichum costaricense]KAK1527296.1 SCP-like extracellular protein [Colletotrichum costaricense]